MKIIGVTISPSSNIRLGILTLCNKKDILLSLTQTGKSPLLWLELSALVQSYFSGDPGQRQKTAADRAVKLVKDGY